MLKIADFGLLRTLQKHSLVIRDGRGHSDSDTAGVEEFENQDKFVSRPPLTLGAIYQDQGSIGDASHTNLPYKLLSHTGSRPPAEAVDASGGEGKSSHCYSRSF